MAKFHAVLVGSVAEDHHVVAAMRQHKDSFTWEHVQYTGSANCDLDALAKRHPMLAQAEVVIGGGEAVIDDALLQLMPRARVCTQMAVGYNGVDLQAAERRGCWVCNAPVCALREATADSALTLMLNAMRRMRPGLQLALSDAGGAEGWDYKTMRAIIGDSPQGLTLGIIGLGRVGQALAYKARLAFGMRVIYYDVVREPPVRTPEYVPSYRDKVAVAPPLEVATGTNENRDASSTLRSCDWQPLDKLLREADVVSLNCNLTPHNAGMMGAPEFGAMKAGSYFVNAARGGLVDEAALAGALGPGGKLAGAGLDVFADEPRINPELLSRPNVFVMPHLSSATRGCRVAMARRMIHNALQVVRDGKAPANPLNQPAGALQELDEPERARVAKYIHDEFAAVRQTTNVTKFQHQQQQRRWQTRKVVALSVAVSVAFCTLHHN